MNSHEHPQFRPAPGLFGDDDNDLTGGSNKSSAEKKKTKFRLETLDDEDDGEDNSDEGEECEKEKRAKKVSTTASSARNGHDTSASHTASDVSSEAKEVPRLKALYNLDSIEDAKQLFQKLSACRALVRGKNYETFSKEFSNSVSNYAVFRKDAPERNASDRFGALSHALWRRRSLGFTVLVHIRWRLRNDVGSIE